MVGPHQQPGRESACLQQLVVASQAFGFSAGSSNGSNDQRQGREGIGRWELEMGLFLFQWSKIYKFVSLGSKNTELSGVMGPYLYITVFWPTL